MENVPAHLLTRRIGPSLTDDLTAGLGGQRPPSLSIRSQQFTLIDAAGNERPAGMFDQTTRQFYVDVIVVDGNRAVSKVFYDTAYDPNASEFKAPACWSDNGVGPSSQAQKPQSPTCAACPQNIWGSAINAQTGKQRRACGDSKKIAIIVPGQAALDMAFLLSIPPNTLNKHWSPYLRTLAGQNLGPRPVDITDVVTRITFDPQTQGTLNFAPVRFIDAAEVQAIEALQASDKTAQLVGKHDTVFQGALPAPVAAPAIAAPQAAPAAQPFIQPATQGFVPPGPTTGQPFIPPAAPMASAPVGPTPTPFPPHGAAQPAPAQRRRRTKEEMEAARGGPAPQAAQAPQGFTPPFAQPQAAPLPQQAAPAPMFAPPQAAPAPQPTVQHGMVTGAPPPPPDMNAVLAAAFKAG